ncbi:hypothetical protein C2G38_2201335 [Gigaspora rosea]|uniref:Uncharacterized protein n=1 Tax=Gigaspora rosea TaxID=44941 RepID=A0A397UPS1_9GLOM|nr:hypothetical protein C2G38_2201335 [Gigaspora rosea]CAG8459577.1 25495_t:CDS:2 [Gigaspora rosea]
MPCYADTIIRMKYVHKNEKVDANLMVVWAIGLYPVKCEQNEIELVLFVPLKFDERDSETQAVFEKDYFYSVGGKIVPSYYGSNKRLKTSVSILNKVSMLNKCLLKVSLAGFSQESPRSLVNDDNAIFNMLINDYAGQKYNFVVKVIGNNFYVYVKDINFIDTQLLSKQKTLDNHNSSESVSTIRSKLLSTHQNVIDNSKESSEVKVALLASTNNFDKGSKFNLSSSKNIFSSNFKNQDSSRFVDILDDVNNYDFYHDEIVDSNIFDQNDEGEECLKKKKWQKSSVGDRKKGRESIEFLNDVDNGGFDYDEAIDTNGLDQNNETEEIQTKKRSRKNTAGNNVKGGKRGG